MYNLELLKQVLWLIEPVNVITLGYKSEEQQLHEQLDKLKYKNEVIKKFKKYVHDLEFPYTNC